MHGSTPAAWTAVLVALVGITLGGIALIPTPHWALFWIGVALSLGSLVVGRVMSAAGLGASDSH
jgi:hypothetical protein